MTNLYNTSIYAKGSITFSGAINAGDVVTVAIGTATYAYTVKASDTFASVADGVTDLINSSNDPNVNATADDTDNLVVLYAKNPGPQGNSISYSVTLSSGAKITDTISTAGTLAGGGNAASVAPGTLVSISAPCVLDSNSACVLNTDNTKKLLFGLSAGTASADLTQQNLPTTLAARRCISKGSGLRWCTFLRARYVPGFLGLHGYHEHQRLRKERDAGWERDSDIARGGDGRSGQPGTFRGPDHIATPRWESCFTVPAMRRGWFPSTARHRGGRYGDDHHSGPDLRLHRAGIGTCWSRCATRCWP